MPTRADIRPRITASGIRNEIKYQLELYQGRSWVDKIALRASSDQEIEDYAFLGATPGWREKIGPLLIKRLREYALSIRNRPYESTLGIPAKWIRRDKTDQVNMKIGEHVQGLANHDAVMLSAWIAAGTGSTYGLGFDGQYYFDNDHSWGDSGTIINLLTASQCSYLDVATATKPTAEEVARAVFNVVSYMMSWCDDQGNKLNATAKEFMVMTGLDLAPSFSEAFTNNLVSTGTGTIENPLRSVVALDENIRITLAINPLFSSWTSQFVVFRTDAIFKPLIIQTEVDPIEQVLDENSDHYKLEDEMLFIFKKSGYWGYGAPYYAAHATLS